MKKLFLLPLLFLSIIATPCLSETMKVKRFNITRMKSK